MKRGQVYYADLRPVVGCEQGGIRPCVIIQNDAGNQYSSTVIVAAMTTKDKKELPTHIAVSAEDYCLDSNTTILLEQLRTIDKSRLQNFVGRLSDGTMRRVDEALHISLALNKEEREVEKMTEMIHIGNSDIAIKEYKGKRVVTFKDIDEVHNRASGTANKRFLDNKKHFIDGEDFFTVSNSEIRKSRIIPISDSDFMDKTLITESGYLMLVKSFTDDLAWDIQRQLVKTYFNATKKLSPEEMMRIQLGMIDSIDSRLSVLEDTMNIDYGQQRVLEDTVNKTVITALGGKESNAYKEIGKKVFAECNHDLKSYFKVNARANVPKKRFEEAVQYAENWKPCTNTMMRIECCNAQMNILEENT
jgi:mRNA-degrading endonuclease toxin of MazEF toxin-antitoxin module